jgi:hypothetical protein
MLKSLISQIADRQESLRWHMATASILPANLDNHISSILTFNHAEYYWAVFDIVNADIEERKRL